MPRLSALVPTCLLALAAALALSACGSDSNADLLPGKTASQINSNLDQVEQLAEAGDCVGAEDAAGEVADQVEALTGIDARLKQALSQGAARLREVVVSCVEAEEEPEEFEEEEIEEPEFDEEAEKEKEKAEKPEKAEKEEPAEGETEAGEGPTLPPPSNGKGEEKGKGGGPVEAESPPSGGIGAGAPAEGEG